MIWHGAPRFIKSKGKDWVITSSNPYFLNSFTDGVLIASMVDGVLLVVHGGKSSRHVVKRARQLLSDVGAKKFGVVLNNVNLRSHDYYYYQRYYGSNYSRAMLRKSQSARQHNFPHTR